MSGMTHCANDTAARCLLSWRRRSPWHVGFWKADLQRLSCKMNSVQPGYTNALMVGWALQTAMVAKVGMVKAGMVGHAE